MPKRIALVVDHPARDLPGLVLVAMKLAQSGAVCYLVPHNLLFRQQSKEFWALAPDLVLLNYVRKNNENFVRQLIDAEIQFGILDTEGGILADPDRYALHLADDPSVRRKISFYCGWGSTLTEHIRGRGWFENASISVTGAPRYDFYAPTWRDVARNLSPYVDDFSKPFVLINGAFPLANPAFQTPEQEIEMYVEHLGRDRESILRSQEGVRENMLAMVELANNLAAAFPDTTFIYRPHPFERAQTYKSLLEPRANLHLVKEGTVDGWLIRACAVVQNGCSTAIEAGFVGVPVLRPGWFPTKLATSALDSVSITCQEKRALFQSLKTILNGTFQFPAAIKENLDKVISDWYFRIDGLAHERIAACIMSALPANAEKTRIKNCEEQFLFEGEPSIQAKMRSTLVKTVGLPDDWSFRKWRRIDKFSYLADWDQSHKFFDEKHVERIVDAVRTQGNGNFPACDVRGAQVGTDYEFDYEHGRSVAISSV